MIRYRSRHRLPRPRAECMQFHRPRNRSGHTNNQLKGTVAMPYEKMIYEYRLRPAHRSRAAQGRRADHEARRQLGTTQKQCATASRAPAIQQARVVYFLVDSQGRSGIGHGVLSGRHHSLGTHLLRAKEEQVSTEELDRIVKTSSGASLAAWRTGI